MKNNLPVIILLSLALFGCNSKSASDKALNADYKGDTTQVIIDNESADEVFCYITQIFEKDKKSYISVDYIQFLTGKEAEAEAKKKGQEVYDDYVVVNDNTKLRTFLIADNIDISLIDYSGQIKSIAGKKISDLKNREKSINICRISAKNGVVTKVEEIYTP